VQRVDIFMSLEQVINRSNNALKRTILHWQSDQKVRAMAEQVALHEKRLAGEKPVIFMNASTRLSGLSLNAGFSLLAGWSLRLAGTPVAHFTCRAGMSRCVLGTNRDNPAAAPPCRSCKAQSMAAYYRAPVKWFGFQHDVALVQRLENMPLEELLSLEFQGIPLGELVTPSLRWVLRRHHLKDDDPTRFLCRQYIQSAWGVTRQMKVLLKDVDPQAVVVFNGMFFPEACARWVAQQEGIRVVSHEVGLRPFTGYFTTGDATAYPIDIPEKYELTPPQDERLDQYLENRFQGNFSMAGIRFWPEMHNLSPEFWQRTAGFDQIVPVFTNVIFDTSQGHANVIFQHMFAWLDRVLEIIRAHPETFFVIRAHPDECRPGKQSRESVADWVKKNQVTALPNVLFVDASEYFSSYELIRKSKFVMVYNSTIGLEAALLGAPVLCGGKARFTQIPTVFFPASADEYSRLAEEFLTAKQITVPPEFQKNARRFLYYQLFRSSLPFDDYLKEDGIWPGYVTLKPFSWHALLPENSSTLRTIVEGIRQDKYFLLDE
jgi:hypothetical protein